MKLFNTQKGIYLEFDNQSFKLENTHWDYIVNQDALPDFLKTCEKTLDPLRFQKKHRHFFTRRKIQV